MRQLFLFTILLLSFVTADWADVWEVPDDKSKEIWHESKHSTGLRKFPGLKVRLAESDIDLIRNHILSYGLSYVDHDFSGGRSGVLNVTSFPYFGFYNLRHRAIKYDAMDFAFNFTTRKDTLSKTREPVLYLQLPTLKYYACEFFFVHRVLYFATKRGMMHLEVRNAMAEAQLTLDVTDEGHIYPQIVEM